MTRRCFGCCCCFGDDDIIAGFNILLSFLNGDDEEDEDRTIHRAVKAREGDEREVCRVEHQFKRHVDHQQVAAHNDAQQTKAEQHRADHQIMFQTNVHVY